MLKSRIILIWLIVLLFVTGALALSGCGGESEAEEPVEAEEPEEQEDAQEDEAEEEEQEESMEDMLDKITINTQSSIKIEGSKTIYIDPYKKGKAAHDADVIFITHSHYDHFDEPSLRNAAGKDTIVICPLSMKGDLERLGIGSSLKTIEAGGKEEIGDITVEAVPAYNLNKNFHPKENGWLGYIISMDGVRYYAAGDTDALPELEDIECDIAFVPVGGTYTMTASEAAGLVNKIGPKYAVPIHYGSIVGRATDAKTFEEGLEDGIEAVVKVEDAR